MRPTYIKFNRDRLPEYQIATFVRNKDDHFLVEKVALTESAIPHLESLVRYRNEAKLSSFQLPSVENIENGIKLEYISGHSFDALLLDLFVADRIKELKEVLVDFKERMKANSTFYHDFRSCAEFKKVFRVDVALKDVWCQEHPNIDLIFENVILKDGFYYIIDFEWTFDFAVPLEYIIYRSIMHFYYNYIHEFRKNINIDFFWELMEISPEKLATYKAVEAGFQDYVYGEDRPYSINKGIKKKSTTLDELISAPQILERKLQEVHTAKDLEIKVLKDEALTLQKQSEDMVRYNVAINSEVEALRSELTKVESRLCDMAKELDNAVTMKACLSQELTQKNEAIDKLLSSKSWKMTKPLRVGLKWLNKLK